MNTYWNGEPCAARKVRVIVGETFYLDDEDGAGWDKVTVGRGSPRWPHSSLDVERVLPLDGVHTSPSSTENQAEPKAKPSS